VRVLFVIIHYLGSFVENGNILNNRSTTDATPFKESLRKSNTVIVGGNRKVSHSSGGQHINYQQEEEAAFVPPPPPPRLPVSQHIPLTTQPLYYSHHIPPSFNSEFDYRDDLHRGLDDIPVVEIDLTE
jgi:hypothetical protein